MIMVGCKEDRGDAFLFHYPAELGRVKTFQGTFAPPRMKEGETGCGSVG